ncbi:putative RNA-directed DNA polymerase from transposon X-element [Bienertia sinuspersici]
MSWNCRGISSSDSPAIPFLLWIVRKFSLNVLFLMETHLNGEGSSSAGGLAVFWSNQVNLRVSSKCLSFFQCKIEEGLNNKLVEWNLLLFYGSLYLASRTQTWANLSYQLASTNLPVIIQGDFNQIESMEQKWGGRDTIPGGRAYSNWKTNWELMDIPFHGVPFTWFNNRTVPRSHCHQSPICLSNHGPILLTTTPSGSKRRSRIQMNSWSLDFDEVGDIIKHRWSEVSVGSAMYSCTSKIKKVRYDLFRWCQQYKKQNHTMWEDLNESCTKAQLKIGRASTITDEHQIRQQSMEEATIKLKAAKRETRFSYSKLLMETGFGKSEVTGLLTHYFQHIYQSGPLNVATTLGATTT